MAICFSSNQNRRPSNEDSFCQMEIRMNHEAAVTAMAVADGMGGMEGGKYFSDLAVKIWFGQLQQIMMGESFRGRSIQEQEEALRHFSTDVYKLLGNILYKQGMDKGYNGGTTLTTAIRFWDTFYISNCGDSPVYAMSEGKLRMVGELHNLAGRMVKEGKTNPGTQTYHQNKNLLVRYLGGKEGGIPFVTEIPAAQTDLLILGSDGAFGELTQEEIGNVFAEGGQPEEMLLRLFDQARGTGETDNQTAILYVSDENKRSEFFDLSDGENVVKASSVRERLRIWRDGFRKGSGE